MTAASKRILVGTASWSDPGFVERWYPTGMAAADRLGWYAQHFEMVEVNSSFYAIPDPRLVERWIQQTPDGFVFNVKLHQLLSRHSAAGKLLPPALRKRAQIDVRNRVVLDSEIEAAVTREILRSVKLLRSAGKMGVLLLQLSPAFSPRKHELRELEPLLDLLEGEEVAIEFRNRSWAEGERLAQVTEFLRARCAALVSVDTPKENHFTIMPPALDEITNPSFAYLRLHGRDARAYTTGKTVAARFNYDYSDAEIAEVAKRAKALAKEAQQVHVVFNNNALDYAPHAAVRLRKVLRQIASLPPRQAELL